MLERGAGALVVGAELLGHPARGRWVNKSLPGPRRIPASRFGRLQRTLRAGAGPTDSGEKRSSWGRRGEKNIGGTERFGRWTIGIAKTRGHSHRGKQAYVNPRSASSDGDKLSIPAHRGGGSGHMCVQQKILIDGFNGLGTVVLSLISENPRSRFMLELMFLLCRF